MSTLAGLARDVFDGNLAACQPLLDLLEEGQDWRFPRLVEMLGTLTRAARVAPRSLFNSWYSGGYELFLIAFESLFWRELSDRGVGDLLQKTQKAIDEAPRPTTLEAVNFISGSGVYSGPGIF